MDKIRLSVSKKLKQYRKLNNLTQEDFAEENNISVKTIAQWEQGNAEVPLYMILKLRKELNQSIEEIYGLVDSLDILTDKEYENQLKLEFVNDKISTLYYLDDSFDIDYKQKKQFDINIFFNTIKNFEINNKNGEIQIKINKEDMPIVLFLISKNLITYEIFKDYNNKSGEIYYNKRYFINKRLALVILNNLINKINLDIDNLDKNIKNYDILLNDFKLLLDNTNRLIKQIYKRGK